MKKVELIDSRDLSPPQRGPTSLVLPTGATTSIPEETFREVVKGSQNVILKGILKMMNEKLRDAGSQSF